MKHIPFDELKPVADVTEVSPVSRRNIRRERLQRFADLLEANTSPVRLFSQLEYLPDRERSQLRSDNSPLTVAFADPVLRSQGLKGDTYSDAIEFFDLTSREAHHLLCDCHYHARWPSSKMIASRARSIAGRVRFRDRWQQFRQGLSGWL